MSDHAGHAHQVRPCRSGQKVLLSHSLQCQRGRLTAPRLQGCCIGGPIRHDPIHRVLYPQYLADSLSRHGLHGKLLPYALHGCHALGACKFGVAHNLAHALTKVRGGRLCPALPFEPEKGCGGGVIDVHQSLDANGVGHCLIHEGGEATPVGGDDGDAHRHRLQLGSAPPLAVRGHHQGVHRLVDRRVEGVRDVGVVHKRAW
mmetsp:Transcript_21238/g.36179  ORF Transcript_21238/g.36179 Transcript_21238/m.36179 type:complete len:202 (+) Transcript_21238:758-1363(+)